MNNLLFAVFMSNVPQIPPPSPATHTLAPTQIKGKRFVASTLKTFATLWELKQRALPEYENDGENALIQIQIQDSLLAICILWSTVSLVNGINEHSEHM